ncbi:Zinc finger, ZZ type [Musa troglodytarum]|uniref:Zinc finger, ZZ type n=1 Tax=Musa troglodytarum TaxID=320322 RepID=A0A9E7HTP3_9LILI|nr:Zinc finger, ZZ type [Musa troglodytarum]
MSDAEEAKATASSPSAACPMAADGLDDEVSSPFQCCVCLDILYKPIVLVEEKATDVYSPQFADQLELKKLHIGNGSSSKNFKDCRSGDFERSDLSENRLDHTIKRNISVDDVSCSLCKEMLYQPAVLNCGHVYCESCLSGLSGEHLQCQVCQSFHPGEFPNICLDLDHFLEEEFPREYAVRRDQVQNKKAQCQHVPNENKIRWHKYHPEAMIYGSRKTYLMFM